MAKKIAIIGCGASGLTAIKCCLDEGLIPVCFERTDHIGGLWYYTDDVIDGQGCVMKSTIINVSKETMCFSDFPMPEDFPVYMHNTKVMDYLHMYADAFDLKRYIHLNTSVVDVSMAGDFNVSGRWNVSLEDRATGEQRLEIYDGVMICTGQYADKHIPKLPGMDGFLGKLVHSQEYRRPEAFADKVVVVVGIGNSAGDISAELSRVTKQVYLSTRRGAWVKPRIHDNGYPVDMSLNRRITFIMQRLLPGSIVNHVFESELNKRFNHANYGLQPTHRFNEMVPTINDDLPNRILSGSILVKSDIRQIGARSIQFTDGTVVDDVDVILLATGYIYGFPFIHHPSMEVADSKVDLYKYVFPPAVSPATLAVIGCVQPTGAILPISELHCRWAARVFNGSANLPSREYMFQNIKGKRLENRRRFVDSPRCSFRIDNITHMDEIAGFIGCKPNFGALFWRDPRLAITCVFGSFCAYQYRLVGPGRWPGAKTAIYTMWDRTLAPTRTRTVKSASITHMWPFVTCVAVFTLITSIVWRSWC